MRGPQGLLESEELWVTDVGKFFPGERVVFRGKDLLQELNEISWMGIHLYGITGRFFSDRQLCLFEAIWTISVSYPDPRIWNNRIAALAGTARSTGPLAISAATAVTEARLYGFGPNVETIEFLLRIQKKVAAGADLEQLIRLELKESRKIPGYGRPLVDRDERIQPLLDRASQLNFDDGPHLKLAFDVERVLQDGRWRLRMNIAALAAALCADQAFTPEQFLLYTIPAYIGGMTPCYIDALNHPEGTLFPLRCSRIKYEGVKPRNWE